jgi:WD40 repeat protein
MSSFGDADRDLAWRILLRLTTAEGTRAVRTRDELAGTAGDRTTTERVIERLVGARLLVVSPYSEDGIEVVHEALFTGWPRLTQWRRAHDADARMRDHIAESVRRWHDRGRPRGLLWRGDALAEYRAWRRRWSEQPTAIEVAFGEASQAEQRLTQLARGVAIAAVLVTLSIGTIGLFRADRRAEHQRQEAVAQRIETERQRRALLSEHGLQELANGHPARALPYLVEAMREGDDTPALHFLVADALRPFEREIATIRDHVDGLGPISWSPDGKRFAAAGRLGNVTVYDAAGRLVWKWRTGDDASTSLQFSPDGTLLAVAGSDRHVTVWELERGSVASVLEGHRARISSLEFVPDGRLLTADSDGELRLWDARTGALVRRDREPAGIGCIAAAGPRVFVWLVDGTVRVHDAAGREVGRVEANIQEYCTLFATRERLVTSARDVRIWDAATLRPIATLARDTERATDVSVDHARLLTGGIDATKIWELSTGKWIAALPHPNMLFSSRFSHDGTRVATTALDRRFRIWNVATMRLETLVDGAVTSPRAPHSTAWALDARFSPDDTRLLTAVGSELKLVRVGREALVREYRTTSGLVAGSLSPDGHRAAGAGQGVDLWDGETTELVAHVPVPGITIYDLAWSPDSQRFVVVGSQGTARMLWSSDGSVAATLDGHNGTVNRALFSPDGCHHRRAWVPDPPGSTVSRDPPGGARTVLRLDRGAARRIRRGLEARSPLR